MATRGSASVTRVVQGNPVLRSFKWEDYSDGYMISFWPQTSFERFEDICQRVKRVWNDEFELEMPPGDKVVLVQPEEIAVWRGHAPEFLKTEVSDGVANVYSEVTQGVLGDCWFMSALNGVALSGRVSEVVSRYDDRKGVYEFKLQRWDAKTREFTPLYICVDRRVPVLLGHKAPAFCYSATPGELWPTLLEKAFAKAIRVWKAHPSAERGGKGFSCMDGGLSALAVAHLLGGRAGCYWTKEGTRWTKEQCVDLAQLFADLFQRGVFINVNFKEYSSKVVGPKGETRGHKGLVAGHSYAILRLEFFNVRGHIIRLVQLRNPWGREQNAPELIWHGAWSERSPLWAQWPEASEICLAEQKDDGSFWMSIEDMADNMDAFEICDAPGFADVLPPVRSKLVRVHARKAPESNELGVKMADDYIRRNAIRGEAQRKKLAQQLQFEREERIRLERELEASKARPPPKPDTSCAPPVEVLEGDEAVVIGSPQWSCIRSRKKLHRERLRTAEAIDAADGVIDGKYYGKPIITTSGSALDKLNSTEAGAHMGTVGMGVPHGHASRTSRSATRRPLDDIDLDIRPRSYSPSRPREYERWMRFDGGLPHSHSVSNFDSRAGPQRSTTRSWIGTETIAQPLTYQGPTLVRQGYASTAFGNPVVSYSPSVCRQPGTEAVCHRGCSLIGRDPCSYLQTPAARVNPAPCASCATDYAPPGARPMAQMFR